MSDIAIGPDSGMNSGILNWPVKGSARSWTGCRINVGGSSRVSFVVKGSERYTIVTRDQEQSEALAALLRGTPGPDASLE